MNSDDEQDDKYMRRLTTYNPITRKHGTAEEHYDEGYMTAIRRVGMFALLWIFISKLKNGI